MSYSAEEENFPVDRTNMQWNKISLTESLENWMAFLPPKLRRLPLIYLAIPGKKVMYLLHGKNFF